MSEPIDVNELLWSLDMLRVDHPVVQQAFAVAAELQEWLDVPGAHYGQLHSDVSVSRHFVAVSIGDIVVWTSEESDGLTRDDCIAKYQEEVDILTAPMRAKTE